MPEVLGYARIAGMPVVTGLYTMLLPMVVYALLGSSRHLVVGADSATAAILAAGLVGLAAPGDPRYVALAGATAVLVAALLLLARLIRLGFLANFLSRTVLVGFLTGVGIGVAVGQLADLLGVPAGAGYTPEQLWHVLARLPQLHLPTALVAAGVIAVVLGLRALDRRIPAALVAVVGAVVAARLIGLDRLGVALLGPVPAGLPALTLPAVTLADVPALLPITVSMSWSSWPRARPPPGPTPTGSTSRWTPTGISSRSAGRTWPPPRPARSWSTAARPRPRWWSAPAAAASSPS